MHIYDNSLKRVHKHLLLAATDKAGNEDCTWPKWAGQSNLFVLNIYERKHEHVGRSGVLSSQQSTY
ncbi:hypothetical protein T4D_14966 [Trichinella pseudospiralis]|uniref:Uncharacterized protein n=1 Tax=Trichinella pseudospiralis TaxID=6337 RepID=A0A0V1FTA2_TRIPS|nr:hypothetical protein T4D_14966 [Trichinella pseudospiralis]